MEPAHQGRPLLHAVAGRGQRCNVRLLLGISAITVPWVTLFTSVVLYILVPVLIAQVWRNSLLRGGQAKLKATLARIQPWSVTALLATLVLLFALQGEQILAQPLVIAMLAVPIAIQVYFNSALAYWLNSAWALRTASPALRR